MNPSESAQFLDLNQQLELALSILQQNTKLMDLLDYVYTLKLPNFYFAAGSIFQTIWNYCDKHPLNQGIKDIDIIYYNKADLSADTDLRYYEQIKQYAQTKGYTYEIDVSNEARMHLYNKAKFGIDVEQYRSSEDAITKWIATVHAIGLTKTEAGLSLYAPFGLSDIYGRTIRPIKHPYNTKALYEQKAQKWAERFSGLTLIEW